MTRFLLSAVCLLLAGTSNAFVVTPHKASSRMVVSQPKTQLHMMEPFQDVISQVATTSMTLSDAVVDAVPESAGISYSRVSYYTILGLYVMSFPGLWSQIKRSTTAKIKRKTFVS